MTPPDRSSMAHGVDYYAHRLEMVSIERDLFRQALVMISQDLALSAETHRLIAQDVLAQGALGERQQS